MQPLGEDLQPSQFPNAHRGARFNAGYPFSHYTKVCGHLLGLPLSRLLTTNALRIDREVNQ